MGACRDDARQQIEKKKTPMAHAVLDIVAENPEVQHVADEMQPAAVQEHVGDERHLFRQRAIAARQPRTNPDFRLAQTVSWRTIFFHLDQSRARPPLVTDKSGKPLAAILGEVTADNPWLRALARRPGVLVLDFPYFQPKLVEGVDTHCWTSVIIWADVQV